MSATLIITLAVFVGVSALVGSVAFLLRGDSDQKAEDRLAMLTSASGNMKRMGGKDGKKNSAVLAGALDEQHSFVDTLLEKFNLRLYYEQADMPVSPQQFFIILGVTAVIGSMVPALIGMNPVFGAVSGLFVALLPFLWLSMKRKFRLKAFAKQLPDALELMARALRSGHSLAAGFSLVAEEMLAPIGKEFQKVFEEQNLGIPMEQSLTSMTNRVPNLDLKFFATAIILQKQTGGDLAEILDKIGYIIRERFKIWGQVQALTGEGRLSGVVLLALPPLLFVAVYKLNPDYVMPLFTDPLGRKMLFFGVVKQLLGAFAIRKIVNIRV
jgi:tight adherence protein B